MKKTLALFLVLFAVSSCDQFGSTRIKNIIDLTPQLSQEVEGNILLSSNDLVSLSLGKKGENILRGNIASEPLYFDGILYANDSKGFVSAYDLKGKKLLWTVSAKGDVVDRHFVGGGVAIHAGKLYVTNGTRYLTVLDAKTGVEEFRKEFSDLVRVKPVLNSSGQLLIQTISNKLYCLNSNNFKVRWMHEGGLQTIVGSGNVHPVLFQNSVIVSYSTGDLFALNIENGEPLWRYSLISAEDTTLPELSVVSVAVQPIISGDFMYFASSNGKLIKLDLHNAIPVWNREAFDIQGMYLHDGIVFVTNNARQIAAFDASKGVIKWVGNLISEAERTKRKPKTAQFSKPYLARSEDGNVSLNVIAANGEMYSFKADNGKLPEWPSISKVSFGVKYQLIVPSEVHLFVGKKIY